MLFLHRAVVIDEHEGAVILGVHVALSPLVPRAKVTFGVVVRKSGLGWAFLLASGQDRKRVAQSVAALVFVFSPRESLFASQRIEETHCQGRLVRCGDTRM